MSGDGTTATIHYHEEIWSFLLWLKGLSEDQAKLIAAGQDPLGESASIDQAWDPFGTGPRRIFVLPRLVQLSPPDGYHVSVPAAIHILPLSAIEVPAGDPNPQLGYAMAFLRGLFHETTGRATTVIRYGTRLLNFCRDVVSPELELHIGNAQTLLRESYVLDESQPMTVEHAERIVSLTKTVQHLEVARILSDVLLAKEIALANAIEPTATGGHEPAAGRGDEVAPGAPLRLHGPEDAGSDPGRDQETDPAHHG